MVGLVPLKNSEARLRGVEARSQTSPARARQERFANAEVRPLSLEDVQRLALRYLERFDSSVANLRRVLLANVRRRQRPLGEEAVERAAALVNQVVERYQESGLVDDRRFAEARVRGLRERGGSARAIRQKLLTKGVAAADVDHALRDGQGVDAERDAARAFAKRRRLGPHRPPEQRAQYRQKDLAAMARAGFSLDVARAVLGPSHNDEDLF